MEGLLGLFVDFVQDVRWLRLTPFIDLHIAKDVVDACLGYLRWCH